MTATVTATQTNHHDAQQTTTAARPGCFISAVDLLWAPHVGLRFHQFIDPSTTNAHDGGRATRFAFH